MRETLTQAAAKPAARPGWRPAAARALARLAILLVRVIAVAALALPPAAALVYLVRRLTG